MKRCKRESLVSVMAGTLPDFEWAVALGERTFVQPEREPDCIIHGVDLASGCCLICAALRKKLNWWILRDYVPLILPVAACGSGDLPDAETVIFARLPVKSGESGIRFNPMRQWGACRSER